MLKQQANETAQSNKALIKEVTLPHNQKLSLVSEAYETAKSLSQSHSELGGFESTATNIGILQRAIDAGRALAVASDGLPPKMGWYLIHSNILNAELKSKHDAKAPASGYMKLLRKFDPLQHIYNLIHPSNPKPEQGFGFISKTLKTRKLRKDLSKLQPYGVLYVKESAVAASKESPPRPLVLYLASGSVGRHLVVQDSPDWEAWVVVKKYERKLPEIATTATQMPPDIKRTA